MPRILKTKTLTYTAKSYYFFAFVEIFPNFFLKNTKANYFEFTHHYYQNHYLFFINPNNKMFQFFEF